MTPNWRSFLESADGQFATDENTVASFGDTAGELQFAQTGTILAPLSHLALLEAAGEDSKSFLHGQLTSDINHLAEGAVQHAAWCSAKGRMQASFLVWRRGDNYILSLSDDLKDATQKRLQMFVLRAKVKVQIQADRVLLGLAGAQAAEALKDAGLPVPATPLTRVADGEIEVIRLDETRFIVTLPDQDAIARWTQLSNKARPVGLPVWQWLDVQHAFPLVTLATKEEFVPQMADFEKIGGVSFHKGCYPGQEVVARTQYLGKVKRHLFRLTSQQALKAGDVLNSPDNPDQSCGMVMTGAPSR